MLYTSKRVVLHFTNTFDNTHIAGVFNTLAKPSKAKQPATHVSVDVFQSDKSAIEPMFLNTQNAPIKCIVSCNVPLTSALMLSRTAAMYVSVRSLGSSKTRGARTWIPIAGHTWLMVWMKSWALDASRLVYSTIQLFRST